MDFEGVIYLTNFIKDEVDDRADKLRDIYIKAVKESDSFRELNDLRHRVVFFDNGVGRALYDECNYLMQAIFRQPENARELFVRMKNLSKDIMAEETRSMRMLHVLFDKLAAAESAEISVGVLDRNVNERYGRIFNMLASSIVYTLLITGGTDSLNGLRWNDKNSLNIKLKILNNELLPRLYDGNTPVVFWRIVKVHDDKRIRFCDYRYITEYISYDDYNIYSDKMTQISDNLYADDHLLKPGEYGVVYTGMGNIVGCKVGDCLARLSEGALVKDGYFGAVTEEYAAEQIRDSHLIKSLPELMAGDRMYVLSPQKACDLLNQYANARELIYKREKGQCLICGKKISSGQICKSHFKTHDRVYY